MNDNVLKNLLVCYVQKGKRGAHISKEDALRLQVDGLPMTSVVQKVFKA